MNAFSAENVAKAIERVKSSSSKQLKALLLRAKSQSIEPLVQAIDSELSLRGSFDLDADSAERHAHWSESVADLDLTDSIVAAFKCLPINEEELVVTRATARTPGIEYQSLVAIRGKGDVGLIVGHMIYERLGFFRKFLNETERMSDLLFQREQTGGGVKYRLTKEAEQAFKALKYIDE